jgi:hypothetical protein
MKQVSLLIASAIVSLASAQVAHAAGEGRIIDISGSGDIPQAMAVYSAVDAAAATAAACRKTTSKTALECECSARSEFAQLRSAYDSAVADHPEWAKPDTTVWWSGKALNFSAIKRALATCP